MSSKHVIICIDKNKVIKERKIVEKKNGFLSVPIVFIYTNLLFNGFLFFYIYITE